jgi:hypothetical protein
MYLKMWRGLFLISIFSLAVALPSSNKDDLFPWEDIDELEEKENGVMNLKYVRRRSLMGRYAFFDARGQ